MAVSYFSMEKDASFKEKYNRKSCSFRSDEMDLKIRKAISGNFLFLFDIPDPDEHS